MANSPDRISAVILTSIFYIPAKIAIMAQRLIGTKFVGKINVGENPMSGKIRCQWCTGDALYQQYHDEEWGVPCRDDQKLFEFIILEGAQAGLAWITVLRKREGYRQAFADFNAETIADFTDNKLEQLLQNPAIIRNRLKVFAARQNARAYLAVLEQYNSFADYLWQFTEGVVIQNNWQTLSEIPATSVESDAMSKDLKQRGFKFVGSTICYAHMQATGMVNDHTSDCFRYRECQLLE
jgi:DNA-3-methyladenine glycosylase I